MAEVDASAIFTFGGGAWLHAFYFGVGAALAEYSRDRSDPSVRFCGVSSGSLVASALAYQQDVNEIFEVALSTFPQSGRNPFRAVSCTIDCIKTHTPETKVCQLVSRQRRLLIGVSKQKSFYKLQAVNIHQLCDRDHAVAVTSASCYLPIVGGVRGVTIGSERYFDGQLTQNWSCLPMLDDVHESDCIVRVTAYHNGDFANLRHGWITPRMPLPKSWTLLPNSIDALRLIWRLGYLRTIEYLTESQDASRLRKHFREPSQEIVQSLTADLQQVICALELKIAESPWSRGFSPCFK